LAGNERICESVTASGLSRRQCRTIQDNLAGGTVTETTIETKDGKTHYEAQVQKSGGEKVEIKVAEDGSIIGVGKEKEEDDDD